MVWEYAAEHVEKLDEKQKEKVEKLRAKYPQIRMDYAVAIALRLDDKDWDIFETPPSEFPGMKEARKRLADSNLGNYDKPDFKFEVFGEKAEKAEVAEGPKEIDYVVLNRCVETLIGKTAARKNPKTGEDEEIFVPGELAKGYMKAAGLEELPQLDPAQFASKEELAAAKKEWNRKANEMNARNMKRRAEAAEKVYREYETILKDARNGNVSADNANYLVHHLKSDHMEVRDKAAQVLKDAKNAVPFEGLMEGEVLPEVWKRDPSVDLSYTNVDFGAKTEKGEKSFSEFFCCAFLGGCNEEAAADYFRLGSISMLDFPTYEDGVKIRHVRAITGACVEREKDGKLSRMTYMLVDSAEGSDRIDPAIVHVGTLQYTLGSGFDGVVFNSHVTNNTPEKFNDFLKKRKVQTGKKRLEAIYSADGGKRYLEYFGGWNFPAGDAEGYVIEGRDPMAQEAYDVCFERKWIKQAKKVLEVSGIAPSPELLKKYKIDPKELDEK